MGFIHPKCFQDVIFSHSETWRNTCLGIWGVQRGCLDQEWSCKQIDYAAWNKSCQRRIGFDRVMHLYRSIQACHWNPLTMAMVLPSSLKKVPALIFQLQRYSLLQPTSTNPITLFKADLHKGLDHHHHKLLSNQCQTDPCFLASTQTQDPTPNYSWKFDHSR